MRASEASLSLLSFVALIRGFRKRKSERERQQQNLFVYVLFACKDIFNGDSKSRSQESHCQKKERGK